MTNSALTDAAAYALLALRQLAAHPVFGGDAPEFNDGGIGREAIRKLDLALTTLRSTTDKPTYPCLARVGVDDGVDDGVDTLGVVVGTGEYMCKDFTVGFGGIRVGLKTRFNPEGEPKLPFLGKYRGEKYVVGESTDPNFDYYLLHVERGTYDYAVADKNDVTFIANIEEDI